VTQPIIPLYEKYAGEPIREGDITTCPICAALTRTDDLDTHTGWHRTLTNLHSNHRRT
jgi:hypothetical protein